MKERNVIDNIYLYAKDLSEPKHLFLIKKRKCAGIKHVNNPNAFIKCSIQWKMFMRILMITT